MTLVTPHSPRPIGSLGPYDLFAPLARGGMAEVWEGRHRAQDIPVAIKFLLMPMADSDAFREAFQTELRAVAGLDHPHIVTLLDYGLVPESLQKATRGELAQHRPYLVMELCRGGSLLTHPAPRSWPALKALLLQLLDALAHAHARGIIHLDLKPENVLVASPDELRPGLKLTDFGIAHLQYAAPRELAPKPRVKPTDRRAGPTTTRSQITGTPRFMAPEQFSAEPRDYGPFTDLYSLGCIAYLLVTGRYPFTEKDFLQLMWSHLNRPPARPVPLYPVPAGLEAWIARLLEKAPHQRFARAADATWALESLERPVTLTVSGGPQAEASAPANPAPAPIGEASERPDPITDGAGRGDAEANADDPASGEPLHTLVQPTFAHHTHVSGTGDELSLDEISNSEVDEALTRTVVSPVLAPTPAPEAAPTWKAEPLPLQGPPPIPETWQVGLTPHSRLGPGLLLGAGLSVYHLRTVPLVGRQSERERLWQALRTVAADGHPQAVVIQGPAGTGKSRLAAWFAERAQEVGAATLLTATFTEARGPGEGFSRLGLRHFQAIGLPREKVYQRIARELEVRGVSDPYETEALTELFMPQVLEDSDGEGAGPDAQDGEKAADIDLQTTDQYLRPVVRLSSQLEHHAVLRRWLELLAQERPVIVWLDDVQWGSDALAFATYLLDAPQLAPAPLLLMLTVQDEALAERKGEQEQLERLLRHPQAQGLRLSPLAPLEQQALVQELLGLEPALAAQVVARTEGNPLFAVQLVGDWIQRGLFYLTPRGFELRPDVETPLPDSLHQVWRARIGRMLELHPLGAQVALELAAALGLQVEQQEWELACAAVGLPRPARLLETLLTHRLVVRVDEGTSPGRRGVSRWSFVHAMLRETLEREALEAGRWQDHHRICARLLRSRYPAETPLLAERLSFHLLAAEQLEGALEALHQATAQRKLQGFPQEVRRLLAQQAQVLDRLKVPESDPRRATLWMDQCRLLTMERHFDETLARLDLFEPLARQFDWQSGIGEALLLRAQVFADRSEPVLSEACARQAQAQFEALRLETKAAESLRLVAINAAALGRHGEAETDLLDAYRRFQQLRDRQGQWRCLYHLGRLAEFAKQPEQSATYLQKALVLAEQLGAQRMIANSLNGLGILYYNDNPAEAARLFERSLILFAQTGDTLGQTLALGNLADTRRMLGQLDAVESHYLEAINILEALRSAEAGNTRLNLALLYLQQERYAQARQVLLDAFADLNRLNEAALRSTYYVGLLLCAAAEGRWLEWDTLWELTVQSLGEALPDRSERWPLTRAAALAAGAGQNTRSLNAYRLALQVGEPDLDEGQRSALQAAMRDLT